MYSVWESKQEIKSSIKVYLEKDEAGNYLLEEENRMPFYLEGPPGVGKTQLTRQVAEELGIGFVSLSITHHTRNTVLGLPVIKQLPEDGESKYTAYTMSEIIAQVMKEKSEGKEEGILLIDEFACMAESLVAPMLAFLQTKNIGNFTLPEGWIMVLCSNPPKYNKNSRTFDMAIMDRVRVLKVDFDAREFIGYGQEKGLHPVILEYLKLNELDIHVCELGQAKTQIIVTPRGWENLSHCLKGYERQNLQIKEELIEQFIKSGEIAHKFFAFYVACQMGDMDIAQLREILEGENIERYAAHAAAKSYNVRWNLVMQLQNLLRERAKGMEEKVSALRDFKTLCKSLEEAEGGSIYNKLPRKISGWERQSVNDTERKWLEKMRQEYTQKVTSEAIDVSSTEKSDEEMRKIMADIESGLNDDVMQYATGMNQAITGAVTFASKIEQGDNLAESLVHMLNKHVGIMDAMARIENPVYLRYLRRAYGNEEAS